MKTKQQIVANWLPRYTGTPLDEFGKYILLVNFDNYVRMFAEWHGVPVRGQDKPMPNATANGITIINFSMGSANAATVMDLLSSIKPKACLFLGKCGGLKKKNKIGDLILPIAAIRGEGASNDYFPPEVPALPAFNLQKAISTTIRNHSRDYWTGTVYTTNRRVWEHDEAFKAYLRLHHRLLQPDSRRGFAARLGSADDPAGYQDRRKRSKGDAEFCRPAPAHRHRLAQRVDQQRADGEALEVLEARGPNKKPRRSRIRRAFDST
jgi:hypothetical protein